ncbi:MAG: manganese efflux pump [Bacteroidales bacterium]|nr:manganese efflux pump [Bacteroidales bacterium]
MIFVELLIIAIGVSMDAFAVSISKGLSTPNLKPKNALTAALWFGGFQALMPIIGYYLGVSFADLVASVDHWIAFVLLGIIGGNMIKESFDKDSSDMDVDYSVKAMFPLAIATSIDALAIGVSMAFLGVKIWSAVLLIGITTGLFSFVGVYIGKFFGCRYKSKAEFVGGFILLAMGLKILLEHTVA